ncbi:hypothetical protein C8A01DRAFT_13242 [Parachaetomium inaequale]|uniref:Fucose-specific lectin n=1 Tax=Parachaetomium inaequale TaxID=2588326 RepID=A0AAN6SV59_9PEZI|nr:hypothetical protein C8A01DRAFT_13242 [Parachaetomium inaequale]
MNKSGWPPGHSDLPEAVDLNDNLPEVVPLGYSHATQDFYEREKHLAQGFAPQPDHYYSTPPTAGFNPPAPERRILGLRRRTFIILAVICGLAVVGIGIGVGLGVGLNASSRQEAVPTATPSGVPDANNDSGGGSSSANNTASGNLIKGSSLAASNYTDNAGNTHLYVFFQAANEELLASTWDSQNKTWATLSISKILASTGLILDLIPATPIAAYTYTNPTFQTRVYFLTTGNSIRELITSEDPTLTTNWRQGRLGSDKLITASAGSKLAALRPNCGTGRSCQVNYPMLAIAYQGENGVIAMSQADDWVPMDVQFGPAKTGAAIGLSSVMHNSNITDVGWSLFYDEDGTLQEFNSERAIKDWTRGPSTGFAPDPAAPNIASFSYDLVNMMIVSVDPDGDLEVRTWDSRTWSGLKPPNLLEADGAPDEPKFSAVAGNPQRRVFGVANGTVHQWEFFGLSPLQWSYVGTVPTELRASS